MSARENLNRWIESLQILAGGDDNPGEYGRAGLAETRRTMLDPAFAEARAEVLAETAALADPAKPEVSFFGQYGPQVAWWLRMLVGRKEQPAAATVAAPDFFLPGHTYRAVDAPFLFHCATHDTWPDGTVRALGRSVWTDSQISRWMATDLAVEDWAGGEWGGWTDVTGEAL